MGRTPDRNTTRFCIRARCRTRIGESEMEGRGTLQIRSRPRQSGNREVDDAGFRNDPHGDACRYGAGEFHATVSDWVAKAKDPRWNRSYTELVYQPMLEVMRYLRANGFKIYIVTGGGQAFVRTFAQRVYEIPPERVIGSAVKTSYSYTNEGRGVLVKDPALLFFDDVAAKPEDIYLFLGRRPRAAFGNSDGDRQMLEYTQGNEGPALTMLVLHDDAEREYAYGPAQGLPDVKLSPFSQATFDEATAKGWSVISMKNDWR